MTGAGTMERGRINYAEWVITLAVLAVLIAAYVGAQGWPRVTAFFPVLLSGAGIVLVIVKMAAMALGRDSSAYVANRSRAQVDASADDELADEDDISSDFAAASNRTWFQIIAWLTAFFVGLYAFGLLIVLPVFTLLYLRVVARMSLIGILLYVLATSGVIYALFVWLLQLPLPEGALFSFG